MTREQIYRVIDEEREFQIRKWGQSNDRAKDVESFMVYMQHYLNEAVSAVTKDTGTAAALSELRKVVALGIACFEVNGITRREK